MTSKLAGTGSNHIRVAGTDVKLINGCWLPARLCHNVGSKPVKTTDTIVNPNRLFLYVNDVSAGRFAKGL